MILVDYFWDPNWFLQKVTKVAKMTKSKNDEKDVKISRK